MLIVSDRALARVIRDRRLAKGWSQAELASRAGLAQPSLSNIERAAVSLSFDTLLRLLGALDLDLHVVPRGESR